jgi:hypothetical protein
VRPRPGAADAATSPPAVLPQDRSIRRPVLLPSSVKERLRNWPPARTLWTRIRAAQLHREYERRREHYARLAGERGLRYDAAAVESAVRARLAARGYSPPPRVVGDVHTFACIPMFGWHRHLLPDLQELGPVTHFDYTAHGYRFEALALANRQAAAQREEMLARVVPAFKEAHARRPVDWVFCYAGGQDMSREVLERLTADFGVPVANMSLDDKQGWAGAYVDRRRRTGAVDITSAVDVYMTSARVACEWHLVEGGRPVYLPEGFNSAAYSPSGCAYDIPVSFIGAAYGYRASAIEFLRTHDVPVDCFGHGWRTRFLSDTEQVAVINRSIVNLGMGGIEYSESLTNVKGRDFEIPGTGGGAYLTSFNPDLALHFAVGEEIACYRNRDEMLELCRHYLHRPEEAREMAGRARRRALREHRWLHRYVRLLEMLGVLATRSAARDA